MLSHDEDVTCLLGQTEKTNWIKQKGGDHNVFHVTVQQWGQEAECHDAISAGM